MKKSLILFLSLIITLNVLTISISAENISASTAEKNLLGITNEEMEIINPNNEFYVLKLYATMPVFAFADGLTIDEIISGDPFYLITENWSDQNPRKIRIDGDKIKLDDNQYDYIIDWQVEFINEWPNVLKNSEITKNIYNEIEVARIYFLDGFDMYQGSCLYIITNKGDYVCYRDMYPSTDYYFMTVEDFREMSVKAVEEMEKFNGAMIGTGYLAEFVDLSIYNVEIKNLVDTPPESNIGETESTTDNSETEATTVFENMENDNEGTLESGANIETTLTTDAESTTKTDIVVTTESTSENISTAYENENKKDKKGCTSSLTGVFVIIPLLAAATVTRTKKED